MTQDQQVRFARALFRLKPELLSQPEEAAFKTIDQVIQTMFGIRATREFFRIARSKSKRNKQKRKWDAKFRYAVACFVTQPRASLREVHRAVEEKFHQRTRATVLESARSEAEKLRDKPSAQKLFLQVFHDAKTKGEESLF